MDESVAMLLGFKTELKLNNWQRTMMLKHCGVARHAWNWGLGLTKQLLEHNKVNPDDKIPFPSAIELHKWLVALVKPENKWYYECSKSTPQMALRALRVAWKDGLEKRKGVPKFKKKGKQDSFTLEGTIKVKGVKRIQVPVIGILKTYEKVPSVPIKTCTISREADRWFISYKVEVKDLEPGCSLTWMHPDVGVDLGVKALATLSTGKVFEGVKADKQHQAKLSRMQWLHRNKVKGSANWKKAQMQIARLHRRVANLRKDYLHKLTTYIAKNHSFVTIEDLNVRGMMANHKLAAAVQDMSFYELRRQLEYKCKLVGTKLIVADRFYPSSKSCSKCGHLKKSLTLDERIYHCEVCNFKCDRDLNAAINLWKYAFTTESSSG
ncbi:MULTISPECIES: RNA-guided endonuclease InsQ/TnpB family protein [Nostocales]|nr:transposase [Tolypothrix bouteillei]